MGENNYQAFPMFRSRVPGKIRFWVILLFPLVFQMSDAIFMGLSSEVAAGESLLREDILFSGFAGMIGVAVTFPILFRLKMHFTVRKIFTIVCLGMALCCTICTFVHTPPVLVGLSFIFGILKLWGSFEGFSTLMRKVAPRYNFAPFLAMVFCVVFGGIEVSGILSTIITEHVSWQAMSFLMIGIQLLMALMARVLLKDFRPEPPYPLKGIDWTGMLLWGIALMGCAFISVYGQTLDWMHSWVIRIALIVTILTVAVSVIRMRLFGEKAYISPQAFRYHNLIPIAIVFLIAAVMMSSESVLQHIFVGEVLGFSPIQSISLRVACVVGILFGGWFGYYAIDKLCIGYKRLTALSFLLISMYALLMASNVSYGTQLSLLWIPNFFYGFGHILIFIVLTTYIEEVVPLQHRFQALTILGFTRIGCGSAIGSALLGRQFAETIRTTSSITETLRDGYSFVAIIGAIAIVLLVLYSIIVYANNVYTRRKPHAQHHPSECIDPA